MPYDMQQNLAEERDVATDHSRENTRPDACVNPKIFPLSPAQLRRVQARARRVDTRV